jgi:two-component system CheB/CheR fusion protein
MPLAVNLGARHFQATGFAQRIEARLAKYDISPDLLVLELTETTLLAEDPSVSAALAHLQSLGLGVSIDDFGTGYSSLQYLKRLPLTELKIDRSLVSKIGDREDRALVAAVIALGRSLQAHVVAEGVETEEQRDLLTSMGCSHAQGFLYSKALPPPDFVQWLHGHEATREPRAPMP